MLKNPFRSGASTKPDSPGAVAENRACDYLRQQGLAIVERNYRTQRGEIDIIARDQNDLVFVEVRLRSHSVFGGAAQSIDRRKQARLISAAQHYLLKTGLTDSQPCRFDAICMGAVATGPQAKKPQGKSSLQDHSAIDWIRDAFRPEA